MLVADASIDSVGFVLRARTRTPYETRCRLLPSYDWDTEKLLSQQHQYADS